MMCGVLAWCAVILFHVLLVDGFDSKQIGLEHTDGIVIAFGDVNSDKFTDVFILDNSASAIDVYRWSSSHHTFTVVPAYRITTEANRSFWNVIPRDFNFDGILDVLIETIATDDLERVDSDRFERKLTLYSGTKSGWGDSYTFPDSMTSDTFVLDSPADGFLDLFGQRSNSSGTFRGFWINKGNEWIWETQTASRPIHRRIFPIYADFDGDCLADMFLVSTDEEEGGNYAEMWLHSDNGGFELLWERPLPSGMGQPLAADLDFSGSLDLIFPRCEPYPSCATDTSLNIFFNRQKALCPRWQTDGNCRSALSLCSADKNFEFQSFDDPSDSENSRVVNLKEFDIISFPNTPYAHVMHFGDFNLDGYPDLLVVHHTDDSFDNSATRVTLLENVATDGSRTFEKHLAGTESFERTLGAFAVTFFDIAEQGDVDVLIMATNPTDTASFTTRAFENNYHSDAFFLKTLSLNGVCTERCSTSPKYPDPKPYGVNFAGATFKFTVTDLNAKKRMAIATQLSVSGSMSVQTPFNHFGLGRTSNYIEELSVGIPHLTKSSNVEKRTWSGLIPNSQLIVIPYPRQHPDKWALEMFVNPSDYLFAICISFVISLLLLVLIALLLYRKQKRVDRQDSKQHSLPM